MAGFHVESNFHKRGNAFQPQNTRFLPPVLHNVGMANTPGTDPAGENLRALKQVAWRKN
jgi:hypothetical protein